MKKATFQLWGIARLPSHFVITFYETREKNLFQTFFLNFSWMKSKKKKNYNLNSIDYEIWPKRFYNWFNKETIFKKLTTDQSICFFILKQPRRVCVRTCAWLEPSNLKKASLRPPHQQLLSAKNKPHPPDFEKIRYHPLQQLRWGLWGCLWYLLYDFAPFHGSNLSEENHNQLFCDWGVQVSHISKEWNKEC